jgi:hypothetical protein
VGEPPSWVGVATAIDGGSAARTCNEDAALGRDASSATEQSRAAGGRATIGRWTLRSTTARAARQRQLLCVDACLVLSLTLWLGPPLSCFGFVPAMAVCGPAVRVFHEAPHRSRSSWVSLCSPLSISIL